MANIDISFSFRGDGPGRAFSKLATKSRKDLKDGIRKFAMIAEKNSRKDFRKSGLNVRTKRLRGSLTGVGPFQKGGDFYVGVGTNVVYAPVHEYGFPRFNIPQRAYIRPALNKSVPEWVTLIEKEMSK
mgnify:CR=1 FL=1|tara:strand:- start:3240 stop:3623 length:384 start_codon:yes stop_codon:yes gene_type:complete